MLSKRLNCILSQITPCETLCDIGSDHALLAIEAVKKSIANRVICAENKTGPLERGIKNVIKHKLEGKIDVVLSNGVLQIKEPCDAWVIAGMGAETIVKIIEESFQKAKRVKQLVLQPQSKLTFFRNKMNELGFFCVYETLVLDDKYYHVFVYQFQENLERISEKEKYIGFDTLKKNPHLYKTWVIENIKRLELVRHTNLEIQLMYQYFNQELLNNQFQDMDTD